MCGVVMLGVEGYGSRGGGCSRGSEVVGLRPGLPPLSVITAALKGYVSLVRDSLSEPPVLPWHATKQNSFTAEG